MDSLLKEIALQKQLRIMRSRESFWEYCKTRNPQFFRDEILYLKNLANILEDLYKKRLDYSKIMINMPPRHGKTYLISLFNQWVLGDSIQNRIITTSYNDTLSTRFATSVRDAIQEINENPLKITYSDIFPNTKIKRGDGAKHLWSLEGSYMNFLASSFNGTLTGFGGNIGGVDDPIKTAKEAANVRVLDEHYDWYANTFLSRLEEGAIQFIIMTRWSDDDLCGKILQIEEDWLVYKYEVYHEDNKELNKARKDYDSLSEENKKMLNPEIMSYESYKEKARHMSHEILMANYHQKPINIEGVLYKSLKTYDSIPKDETGRPLFEEIKNYTDTADTGDDYLCSINYGVYQGYAYLLDVYYTQDPQEITEPETADFLVKSNVTRADFESNNGGRAFARNVEEKIWKRHKKRVYIKPFHQSSNKEARIISNSATVQNVVLFPNDWRNRWPDFYKHITSFQRIFKANKHDDGADALTGVVEKMNTMKTTKPMKIKIKRG